MHHSEEVKLNPRTLEWKRFFYHCVNQGLELLAFKKQDNLDHFIRAGATLII